jgi:hydroxymethylpyrimidine pyrophosphatase-like HAD family hydrolase
MTAPTQTSPVILTDLDDTIFSTLKSYPDIDPETLTQVAASKVGSHSYMCDRRKAVLDWLGAGATVIPVTARSLDAYHRVQLSFEHGAVLANGALILTPDSEIDQTWFDQVRGHCEAAMPAFTNALQAMADFQGESELMRANRHFHGETMIGMTIKSNDPSDAVALPLLTEMNALLDRIEARDRIVTHLNGNNLALVPVGVSKRAAVEYLLETRTDLANRPLIGAGDSTSDLPFMDLCDMMMIPRGSRAAALLEPALKG